MMKHYKERVEPSKKIEYLSKITCDLCGKNMFSLGSGYSIEEVTIDYKTGEQYPEGGSGKECKIDMCGDCFETKFTEWLMGQGVKIKYTDWDY